MLCNTLHRYQKRVVDFDPKNAEHRKAYLHLILHGTQHPNLHFYVERPFTSIATQLPTVLALTACSVELEELGLSVEALLEKMKQDSTVCDGQTPTIPPHMIHGSIALHPKSKNDLY